MADMLPGAARTLPPPLSGEALENEFDCLMARAGIAIPEGRRGAIFTQFADLRVQIALLHVPRPASLEPSNVFRVVATPESAS